MKVCASFMMLRVMLGYCLLATIKFCIWSFCWMYIYGSDEVFDRWSYELSYCVDSTCRHWIELCWVFVFNTEDAGLSALRCNVLKRNNVKGKMWNINITKTWTIWARLRENLSSGVPLKPVSNRSPHLHRLSRKLKFHLYQIYIWYFPKSE